MYVIQIGCRTLEKIIHYGADKDLMTKLSLDEQTNVLEHGMEMLYKWTGVYPIAHRSGGYSVNKDTLRALKSVGIPIDSSMYYGHPNSHETWSRNAIIKRMVLLSCLSLWLITSEALIY